MLKSKESKEKAQKVGYRGEEFVYNFQQHKYSGDADIEVKSSNKGENQVSHMILLFGMHLKIDICM